MRALSITIALIMTTLTLSAQNILGTWKTIDDDTGEARSHIEIYEKNDKIFGKVVEILKPGAQEKLCEDCEGEDKNVKILGMDVIKNLEKDGDIYNGGTITDPSSGKVYRSKIWLNEDDPNRLNVRGYIAFFYRTQEWVRLE